MARKPRKNRSRRQPRGLLATTNKESLQSLWNWFLPDESIFSKVKLHGNTKWTPLSLVWLGLCWAWSEARHVTDAFLEAMTVCETMFGAAPLTSYQGFMAASVRWTATLLPLLQAQVQTQMQALGSKFWRSQGWLLIAFDGSRSSTPRTHKNEAAFCAKNYGQGKTAKYRKKKSKGLRRRQNEKNKPQPPKPQAWITLLWHMGLRLPWSWRLGPSHASKRAHVLEMLQSQTFPHKTLFCGDAGFVGYPLWASLVQSGHHFLVRVGANVNLLYQHAQCTLPGLGQARQVLCWPKEAQREAQPPLPLRLLQVRIGKTSMWLLTSVLDRAQLTAAMARRFYQMRWGVEVEWRGLKQTLDRGKLRCRNDQRLVSELNWSLLAMTVAELFALKEQQAARSQAKHDPPAEPLRRSLAGTMRVLRQCMRHLHAVPPPGKELTNRLQAALTDAYRRRAGKQARYRPKNPDKTPLGEPEVRPLEPLEKQKLKELKPLRVKLAA